MKIPIVKLQGAGNDFIMLDNRALKLAPEQKVRFVRHFCRPRLSVGADGVAFLEDDPELDLAWDFYNSDGSPAEMCGNGSRCFAVFATSIGAAKSPFTFRTLAGPIRAEITQPLDASDAARARVQLTPAGAFVKHELAAEGRAFTGYLLNTGVPHFVVPLPAPAEFDAFDVARYGRALRFHERFAPAGANVNFLKVDGAGEVWIRTYERGVEAETLACGTGSVASAIVAGEVLGVRAAEKVVHTRGGDLLRISYAPAASGYDQVFLEGPAVRVFVGEVVFPG